MPPLQISPWLTFLVPIVLTIFGLMMTYISLRQKASERDILVYKDTVDARMKSYEREIDNNRREIVQLKEEHKQCQRDLRRANDENLNLMRRLMHVEDHVGIPPLDPPSPTRDDV